jgi:hypothetical protein
MDTKMNDVRDLEHGFPEITSAGAKHRKDAASEVW